MISSFFVIILFISTISTVISELGWLPKGVGSNLAS